MGGDSVARNCTHPGPQVTYAKPLAGSSLGGGGCAIDLRS